MCVLLLRHCPFSGTVHGHRCPQERIILQDEGLNYHLTILKSLLNWNYPSHVSELMKKPQKSQDYFKNRKIILPVSFELLGVFNSQFQAFLCNLKSTYTHQMSQDLLGLATWLATPHDHQGMFSQKPNFSEGQNHYNSTNLLIIK